MVLNLHISAEAEEKLKVRAAAAGVDVATYAARFLELVAGAVPSLGELAGEGAGAEMSEDEVAEFLEEEKHQMRAEKRAP